MKIRITVGQINKYLKELMATHNFKRKVKPFHKAPADVTLEDVEKINDLNAEHNKSLESKKQFNKGDIVKILLKKKLLQKGRHQKWSDGLY